MEGDDKFRFIAKVESLVTPKDVTAISFLGDFNRILPLGVQRRMMQKGSQGVPYMGFIVDPYCFFLGYEILDPARAQALLPPGYALMDSGVFAGDQAKPLMIIGVFSARTSAFAGTRLEVYLIARREKDGQAAWIIVDYLTDTNSYDSVQGFTGYNASPALHAVSPAGELLVDLANPANGQRLALKADLTRGKTRDLDWTTWVQGNLTVDYGGRLSDPGNNYFSLIFDPDLMNQALELPKAAVQLEVNNFFPDLIKAGEPLAIACFPYSQHFIIRQDLPLDGIRNVAQMEAQSKSFIEATNFRTMRGDDIKRPILIGMLVSAVMSYGLIAYLLVRVLS